MCRKTLPSLVQTMACRLFGGKSLTWTTDNNFEWHLNHNTRILIQENDWHFFGLGLLIRLMHYLQHHDDAFLGKFCWKKYGILTIWPHCTYPAEAINMPFQAYTFYRSSSSPRVCNAFLETSKCWRSAYWQIKGLRMVARALWRSEARRVVPWSETLHEP